MGALRNHPAGKSLTVAVAGQPNTGKSTLFNRLTGLNQRVGNWTGKTVDRKEGAALWNGVYLRGSARLLRDDPAFA